MQMQSTSGALYEEQGAISDPDPLTYCKFKKKKKNRQLQTYVNDLQLIFN